MRFRWLGLWNFSSTLPPLFVVYTSPDFKEAVILAIFLLFLATVLVHLDLTSNEMFILSHYYAKTPRIILYMCKYIFKGKEMRILYHKKTKFFSFQKFSFTLTLACELLLVSTKHFFSKSLIDLFRETLEFEKQKLV